MASQWKPQIQNPYFYECMNVKGSSWNQKFQKRTLIYKECSIRRLKGQAHGLKVTKLNFWFHEVFANDHFCSFLTQNLNHPSFCSPSNATQLLPKTRHFLKPHLSQSFLPLSSHPLHSLSIPLSHSFPPVHPQRALRCHFPPPKQLQNHLRLHLQAPHVLQKKAQHLAHYCPMNGTAVTCFVVLNEREKMKNTHHHTSSGILDISSMDSYRWIKLKCHKQSMFLRSNKP